jgi:two-component system OmpR family sensor kinase
VANASHELRTPLTRLRLHLERACGAAGAGSVRELDLAVAEVDRLVRLVDSLLVLARDVSTGLPREVVNVADVARQAVGRAFAAPEAAVLTAPDEALVSGDEDLLAIAVFNLVDNARKFSAGGPVAVAVAPAAGTVTLSVTSPGARVEADDRERVFERFYRAPEARPGPNGHGLGLPLARHIARLHGGDARCASAPDEDARFVLEIPAWRPRVS